jgi:hypothetical protein
MTSTLALAAALSLSAALALAQDVSKLTTQTDCEKAGGKWNDQTNGCAEQSAKMGKEEGTHEGTNLNATPQDDTKKVDQPPRSNP